MPDAVPNRHDHDKEQRALRVRFSRVQQALQEGNGRKGGHEATHVAPLSRMRRARQHGVAGAHVDAISVGERQQVNDLIWTHKGKELGKEQAAKER